jgi:prepilin-type processing-associated H-X9-DG protein
MGANLGRSTTELPDTAGTFLICDTSRCLVSVAGNADAESWIRLVDMARPATDWAVQPPGAWDRDGRLYYTETGFDRLARPIPRHAGGLNIIYADGHAKWMKITQFVGPLNTMQGWPYGHPSNSWDNR